MRKTERSNQPRPSRRSTRTSRVGRPTPPQSTKRKIPAWTESYQAILDEGALRAQQAANHIRSIPDELYLVHMRREDFSRHRLLLLAQRDDFISELEAVRARMQSAVDTRIRQKALYSAASYQWQDVLDTAIVNAMILAERLPPGNRQAARRAELALIQHPDVAAFEQRWHVLLEPHLDSKGRVILGREPCGAGATNEGTDLLGVMDDYFLVGVREAECATVSRLLLRHSRNAGRFLLVDRAGGFNELREILPHRILPTSFKVVGRYDMRIEITGEAAWRDSEIVRHCANRTLSDFRELRRCLYPKDASEFGDTDGRKRVRCARGQHSARFEWYSGLLEELRRRWEDLRPIVSPSQGGPPPASMTGAGEVE